MRVSRSQSRDAFDDDVVSVSYSTDPGYSAERVTHMNSYRQTIKQDHQAVDQRQPDNA